MAAKAVELATAVAAELTAATLSQAYTVVRTYVPAWKIDDLATAKLAVVSADQTEETLTRATVDGRYEVQVGFAKRTTAEATAANDAMLLLVQEAADLFRVTLGRDLEDVAGAKLVGYRFGPLYDVARLRETGIFYAVLSLVYAAER